MVVYRSIYLKNTNSGCTRQQEQTTNPLSKERKGQEKNKNPKLVESLTFMGQDSLTSEKYKAMSTLATTRLKTLRVHTIGLSCFHRVVRPH